MGLGSLKDLYLDELGTLYDAEVQMIRALPRLSEAAHAPELRDTLTKHCRESRLHIERIELIFTHWGERRPLRSSAGLAGIVQEADERLNQEATPDARDAAIIGGGAGVGAAIGAIAGGGKGAAIGAAVGGGAGTGTVLATKGKEIHYSPETRIPFTLTTSIEI